MVEISPEIKDAVSKVLNEFEQPPENIEQFLKYFQNLIETNSAPSDIIRLIESIKLPDGGE